MRSADSRVNGFARALIGWLGTVALLLACWQMAQRYFFPQMALMFVEETVIYLIAWATFLGVAVLVYEDDHVRADVIFRVISKPGQRFLEIVNSSLGLMLCAVIGWYGYLVTIDAFLSDERSVTGAAIPMWLFYASLPTGMILSTMWFARRLVLLTWRFDPAKFAIHSGHEA